MKILLKLKSWQVFIILFILQYLYGRSVFGTSACQLVVGIVTWYVAKETHKKVPSDERISIDTFAIIYWISFAYLFLVNITIGSYRISANSISDIDWKWALLIPFHILTMVGVFYTLYFVARNVRIIQHRWKAKHNMHISLTDNVKYFFLVMFFFPIGVWFIQPILNRTFADDAKEDFITD